MTTAITKRAIPAPDDKANKAAVEALRTAMNELGGVIGDKGQRAVRVCELIDAGILKFDASGLVMSAIAPAAATDLSNYVDRTTAQSIAGLKTFADNLTVNAQKLTLGATYAGSAGIELGRTDSTASTPYIDMHSGATATDFDVRLIASGGDGTNGHGVLTLVANEFDVDAPILIAPANTTTFPLRISGAFTGNGRTVQWDNNDTSTQAAMALQMLAGASGNMQLTQLGTEYTAVPGLAGKTMLQNIGGTGLVLSAAAAGTDIQFWFSGNSLKAVIDTTGINHYGTYYYGSDKKIIQFSDTWLRLNPGNDFTSGIYGGTGAFRIDGSVQVGAAGATFLASNTTGLVSYGGLEVGFRGLPINTQNAAYTLVADDNGKCVLHTTTTSHTFTVPSMPAGTVITVCHSAASGAVTLTGSGANLFPVNSTAGAGNRTLGPRSVATLFYITSTSVLVGGPGVS